jgi:hypothetical protein
MGACVRVCECTRPHALAHTHLGIHSDTTCHQIPHKLGVIGQQRQVEQGGSCLVRPRPTLHTVTALFPGVRREARIQSGTHRTPPPQPRMGKHGGAGGEGGRGGRSSDRPGGPSYGRGPRVA